MMSRMRSRWNGRVTHAPALLALALCLALAPLARAADQVASDTTDEGWKKVLAYGRCALAVFKALTPSEWAAAFFDCGRTFLDEPSGAQP
jgi:hypothetical protein